MANAAAKDFGSIRDDYAFFQDNSTERKMDLAGYAERVKPFLNGRQYVSILDFGCGPGNFTAPFLERTGLRADQLELSLVEPEPGYLQTSLGCLQRFSQAPLQGWAALPKGTQGRFDLILSNHALYYVPDLGQQLDALILALKPGGMLTTAMAGSQNQLIMLWEYAFGLVHQAIPYNILDTLEELLDGRSLAYQESPVPYSLEFPDSQENRRKILRFLLTGHLDRMPMTDLERWFDTYSLNGRIRMDIQHQQVTIRR